MAGGISRALLLLLVPAVGVAYRPSLSGIPLTSTAAHRSSIIVSSAAPSVKSQGVSVDEVHEANGGWILNCRAEKFGKESKHSVIVSKGVKETVCKLANIPDPDVPVEEIARATLLFMMDQGMDMTNTEGMYEPNVFPVNYFTTKQLRHTFPDVFEEMAKIIGKRHQAALAA